MDHVGIALFIGTGAMLGMDLRTFARGRLFGTPLTNYGLVGRWFPYMPRGRFRHDRIAAVPPVPGEQVIGWTAHYLVGIAFAVVLLAICGLAWARQPTFAPALALGVAMVAAPLLPMQPGMGAGIAASRTPRPHAARAQSLVTHAVFGVGLYAAALAQERCHHLARGVSNRDSGCALGTRRPESMDGLTFERSPASA